MDIGDNKNLADKFPSIQQQNKFLKENDLVGVMIRGHPKMLKNTQIDKFKDNYAQANL